MSTSQFFAAITIILASWLPADPLSQQLTPADIGIYTNIAPVLSSDGNNVFHLGTGIIDGESGPRGVYRMGTDGQGLQRLDHVAEMGGAVSRFRLTPDESNMIYQVEIEDQFQLWSVPVTGGIPERIPTGMLQLSHSFSLREDYILLQAKLPGEARWSIYSMDLDGGNPIKLNGAMVEGGGVTRFFLLRENNNYVIFYANKENVDTVELYSARINQPGGTKLNAPLAAGTEVKGSRTVGRNILYFTDIDDTGKGDVFHVDVEGGPVAQLTNFGTVSWTEVSPDQSRVLLWVYLENENQEPYLELFSMKTNGDDLRRLTDTQNAQEGILNPRIDPTSNRVIYQVDLDVPGRSDIWSVPLAGGEAKRILVNDNPLGIRDIRISPDGQTIIYEQLHDDLLPEIYSLKIEGGQSVRLSGSHPISNSRWSYINSRWSYNDGFIFGGRDVVFNFLDTTNPERSGMYRVPITGGIPRLLKDKRFPRWPLEIPGSHAILSTSGFSLTPTSSIDRTDYSWHLGGREAVSEYDQLSVPGTFHPGDHLKVCLMNDFQPEAGDSFDLWEADSVEGSFAQISLPQLPDGLHWKLDDLYPEGTLQVIPTPSTYPDFAAFHHLTGGPGKDDDGDTLSNLAEFALGGNPTVDDLAKVSPRLLPGEDQFSFCLPAPLISPVDVRIILEESKDLKIWNHRMTLLENGTYHPGGNLIEKDGMRWFGTASSTDPDQFYLRLKFERVP